MCLKDLIGKQIFEDVTHENKARLDREDIVGWLKTIAGFANNQGGELFIGVEDKSGKLIGFDKSSADNERNFLNNKIKEHLFPRPIITITFPSYEIRGTTRYLILVKVSPDSNKPVILKYNGVPAIYIRREGFTNGASYEEIIEMAKKILQNMIYYLQK
ncbi:ATP-binding protein [Bullifex sp.]|uniref:AlbA family DNA-binding domain-containing protein n=1 Tax=Bullifex sp. TaxID=2815808 RepID=UPI002A836629|nr:ATP-binding protein [Bullifex sp.]MDD5973042.1 ATP-binding protein [Spirochaetales bacterium]MDY4067690.1 ATP-binding protein [Bullifex sp.]